MKTFTENKEEYDDHKDFSKYFTEFKEGEQQIDESKELYWMDIKMKIRKVDILTNGKRKMENISEYWLNNR